MQPAISYHLGQAHVADLRYRAQRDTVARAARLARTHQPGPARSRLGAWGRRAQAGLLARMTRGYQRRWDARVAQTQRPVPNPIRTCYDTRPHGRSPHPSSGRAGDRLALIRGVAETPIRAYPILSSPSEEGHAHHPE